jgi:hypothetical protein
MSHRSNRPSARVATAFALACFGPLAGCAAQATDGEVLVDRANADLPADAAHDDAATAPSDAQLAPADSEGVVADMGSALDAGATTADSGSAPHDAGATASDGGGTVASTKSPLGKFVVTWYSFQDNTPVNSALSASGRKLVPYLSVAVPFRLLKPFGGALDYGDRLYLQFLDGRSMPNGTKHTGWVQIDDFCGDSGDDSYCFQTVGGVKYPNTDLYIGDFTKSGMDSKACSGPAGSGQELTNVSTGAPGSAWIADYGGKALGSGKCGDVTTAKPQQGSCWDYTPPASSASDCVGCAAFSCTTW